MSSKHISLTLKEEIVDAVERYNEKTHIPRSQIYAIAVTEFLERKAKDEKSEII